MLLHKPQQAGKWARFLPKTIPLFSVHFVLSEKGSSRGIATYQPIASLLSFFVRRVQEKRILFWGIYRSEILLHSCTICRLKTSNLSAPLYPKYILSGRKPALTRHFKAAISRHSKLQKARPFPFGPAFSLQPRFSHQIKERRTNALRSVPSHKGCYTVGRVQSKKIDWKG